jgi:D-alanyl-D-alanine carboxypeptidase
MRLALAVVLAGLFARPAAAVLYENSRPRSQSPAAQAGGELTAEVEAYVRADMGKRRTPGLSIAVVRDGKVVLTKGYGFADLEHRARATPATVYQLASVTKQFTGAAVQMLIEDGKLALSDAVTKHLPEVPAAWSGVTVRHLLTHTSGIKSYTNLPSFMTMARKDFSKEELISLVREAPLEFQPGEKWAYSNTGYFLLGMLVEKASGGSYGEFLEKRIFEPLGMTSTRVNDLREVIKNRAQGFTARGGRILHGEYLSPTQPFSAGALVSTVEDMAKWDAALYTDRVLTKGMRDQAWTPEILKDGSSTHYGFGWELDVVNGHRQVSHGGGIPGFSTNITRFVDDRLTVIVLANSDNANAGSLARGIAALYLPAVAPRTEKAEDKEPKTTAEHRKIVLAIASGTLSPELFTPQARALIFPERAEEGKEMLSAFGPLRALTLLDRSEQSGLRTHRYRALFGTTPVTLTFAIDKDSKIAGLGIGPGD